MRRPLEICFCVLMSIQVLSVWIVRYYPSNDGPSHLYNAAVLANYNRVPAYREFYSISVSPAGNFLAQLLQSGLLKIAGEVAAEKLLLTFYIVLLPLSFRYLLATVTAELGPFVLCGLVFLPNFFFYMGFWNFCLSIPLLLFALAHFRRKRCHWTWGSVIAFGVLSFLTYSAHPLSWAVLSMLIGLDVLVGVRCQWKLNGWAPAWRSAAVGLITVNLPALLVVGYLGSVGGGLEFGGTARERAAPLYGAGFLRGLGSIDRWLSTAFVVVVLMLACRAVQFRLREWRPRSADAFLLFGVALAVVSVCGPSEAASGAYVRGRLALYAWMFFVIWLASAQWSLRIRAVLGVALGALVVAALISHLPAEAAWNEQLAEYASARRFIVPGSTILPIQMESQFPRADPMAHAVDLLALGGSIDLFNYEALLPYFSIQFRPDRTPIDRLVHRGQSESSELVLDIDRYEKTTGKHVDYVLAYGGAGAPELQRYGEQLAGFEEIYVSQPRGQIRLYQRRQLRRARWLNAINK